MTKKMFNLVVGVVGGISAIAVAVITYVEPTYAAAINASIPIASTAIIEICSKFVKN